MLRLLAAFLYLLAVSKVCMWFARHGVLRVEVGSFTRKHVGVNFVNAGGFGGFVCCCHVLVYCASL